MSWRASDIGHRDPEWHLQGADSAYLAPSLRSRMAVGSCQLPALPALVLREPGFAARVRRVASRTVGVLLGAGVHGQWARLDRPDWKA